MCNKLPINLQLNESRDSVKFWTSNIDGRSTELTVYYYKVSYSFPHPSPRPKKMEIIFTISRTHCRFNQIWLHNSSAEQLVQLSKQNKNQLYANYSRKLWRATEIVHYYTIFLALQMNFLGSTIVRNVSHVSLEQGHYPTIAVKSKCKNDTRLLEKEMVKVDQKLPL